MIKRILLLLLLCCLPVLAFTQTQQASAKPSIQLVSVSSKGQDVRAVLHDLFTQIKKNYVMEPNVHFVLYLSLTDLEFEEALALVCKTANLKYEVQNGIYFVSHRGAESAKPVVKEKPAGKVPATLLRKHVSINGEKMDIRQLFASLKKQTDVEIEVNATVPAYKLDVVLKDTTLSFALKTVCQAAGLTFTLTDHQSVEITKPANENHVTLHL